MTYHLRRQIREAVAGAVTGLTTTGSRVYQSRVYPLQDANLPALLVRTRAETSAAVTAPAPRYLMRTLQLEVIAVAKANADLDDELDQICSEVEVALAMPCAALGGLAKTITLTGTELELVGTAETPTGQATMSFDVVYIAAENAPAVAQ